MTPEESDVRRVLYWIAIGLIGVNAPLTVGDVAANPGLYRFGAAWWVVAAVAALVVVAGIRLRRGTLPDRELRAAVVVSLVALALHPVLVVLPVSYPPLLHLTGAALSVSAVLSVRWSLILVPVLAAWVVWLRAPFLGWWQSGVEGLLFTVGGVVGAVAFRAFGAAGRSVDVAVGRARQAAWDKARLSERAAARERWDGLVHDMVLGALGLAAASSGSVPVAAKELAREALAAMRGGNQTQGASIVDRWREHAQRLGMTVVLRVDGDITDPDLSSAVHGAVLESLTNVMRHSGRSDAVVSGSLSDDETWLMVRDQGCGFDPTTAGMGLRTSVISRMRAVGGDAEIRSRAGEGTQVVLRHSRPCTSQGDDESVGWQLRSFAPLVAMAWFVLGLVVIVSWPRWSNAVLPWVSGPLIIALAVITWVATTARPRLRTGAGLVAAAGAAALVGVLNTPLGTPVAWRYWYLSAMNPALVAVSYRFSRWMGIWSVVLVTIIVVGVDVGAGRAWWAAPAVILPVLIGTVVAAQVVRLALAEAWATIERATREAAGLRLARLAEAERERETRLRGAVLEQTVGPALDRLAEGGFLEQHERDELHLLASAVRDQLAAPDLLDASLVAMLRKARSRGIVVDVVALGEARVGADLVRCDVCQQALCAVLTAAEPETVVRVNWSPGRAVTSTVTAVGAGVDLIAEAVERVLSPAQVQVSRDEDSLMVEFAASQVSPT